MIASVIMLILAGYMYYSGNNNQYAIFIGIGGILIYLLTLITLTIYNFNDIIVRAYVRCN